MAASLRCLRLSSKTLLKQPEYFSHIPKCRRGSSAVAAAVEHRKWQLHSAVCLQRFPVITQDLTPLEGKFQKFQQDMEVRESSVSDHEFQEAEEIKESKKKKSVDDKNKADKGSLTVSDIKRNWEKELEAFQAADRITEADRTNNTKSVERKLDRKLLLVVKHAFDSEKEGKWRLPQVARWEGESMREAAERALSDRCGEVNATFVGNAPCGYSDYKLPPNSAEEYGVKLFYFKANYNEGKINLGDKVTDHRWLTLEETKEYLHSDEYQAVKEFIIEY